MQAGSPVAAATNSGKRVCSSPNDHSGHVTISSRPQGCSMIAVRLSTQSPSLA